MNAVMRILFRWKLHALIFLIGSAGLFLTTALLRPLTYQAQVTLERKPLQTSFYLPTDEFNVTRLTSETQRTLAMIKSKFILGQWRNALPEKDPVKTLPVNRAESKLARSLTVKPINFTDVFFISVNGDTPSQAKTRADTLVEVYLKWDQQYSTGRSQKIIEVLKRRTAAVRLDLEKNLKQLDQTKNRQNVRLLGSARESALKTEIKSKEKLYDEMINEIELAERELEGDGLFRLNRVTDILVSEKPLISRAVYLFLAVAGSLFLTTFFVVLLEAQYSRIDRVGQIQGDLPAVPVLTIPLVKQHPSSLSGLADRLQPVVEEVKNLLKQKDAITVQFLSYRDGDGKQTIQDLLLQMLKINNVDTRRISFSALNAGDNPSWNDAKADLTCLVVQSAKTPRDWVRFVAKNRNSGGVNKIFTVLNRYQDPLPTWARF